MRGTGSPAPPWSECRVPPPTAGKTAEPAAARVVAIPSGMAEVPPGHESRRFAEPRPAPAPRQIRASGASRCRWPPANGRPERDRRALSTPAGGPARAAAPRDCRHADPATPGPSRAGDLATPTGQSGPRERLSRAWLLSEAGGTAEPASYGWMRNVAIPIVGFATVGRDKQASATPLPGACMTPYSGSADVDAVATAFGLASTRRFG